MTIKHLYPVIEPSLNLDFANSKKLDSRITFTRGSIGTYVGDDGLIKTAVQNEARFDHDSDGNSLGLLVEESRVNSLRYSQDFTDTLWVKTSATIIPNSVIAPDGTLTGSTMKADAGTAILPSVIQNAGDSAIRTLSLYAKMGTYRYLKINPRGQQYGLVVDLQDGSVYATGNTGVVSADIVPAPNGWYRLILTTDQIFSTRIFAIRFSTNANNNSTFDFDGTETVYIWGAELETGSFPTSYIPTSGSTVTRAADVASITGSNFSSWYNQSEGTVVSNSVTTADPAFTYTINDGTNSNRLGLNIGTDYGQPFVTVSGTSYQYGTAPTLVAGGGLVAFGYKANDYAAYGDATALTGSSPTSVPTGLNELAIGFRGTYQSDTHLNGHISRLTYYPQRLPDATLQALTL